MGQAGRKEQLINKSFISVCFFKEKYFIMKNMERVPVFLKKIEQTAAFVQRNGGKIEDRYFGEKQCGA